ncbi:MAG TPA: GNAT family N-acetyltransferase [Marmoricola sp.]
MSSDVLIRPMQLADVEEAERLSAESYLAVDRESWVANLPEPVRRSSSRAAQWIAKAAHFLTTDPAGCWVACVDGRMVGFALSFRRELCWFLASYAVRPALRGSGIGKPLLDAALGHSVGCLRGMLAASDDPRAFRRYALAGFVMHPQMTLHGVVDRSALPVGSRVREGTPSDFELMDSVDRRCRDSAHGVDHQVLSLLHRLLVLDGSTGSGYAYVDDTGAPVLLAATNRRTAARLLWEALASSSPDVPITLRHVTAANDWAVSVGLEARLSASTQGYLGLRGMKPPMPYLHHGSFL